MGVGTGADTLQNIPAQPYVIDPAMFFQLTSRNVHTFASVEDPGGGSQFVRQLPQSGILSMLTITFVGTMAIDNTADAITRSNWPYGLISLFKLSVNGQNDLFSCNGMDLAVLRDLRNPAYSEATDQFPGTVGGGDTITKNVTYGLSLTWQVPVAMDNVSLIGSLFAQSSSTNISATIAQETNTNLLSQAAATTVFDGTFYLETTFFEVPFDDKGQLVVPDLSRLHGFNAIDVPVTAVGENIAPLIRSQGQLVRLHVSTTKSANARLSALAATAAASKIDALRFQYGGNQRPYVFQPASRLLSIDNEWYGATPLYDRLVLDLVKENPARDVILMQGITEPQIVVTVNAAATVAGGQTHLVQETLF